jgi:mono/diheme cytochrome c family protein
MFRNLMRRPGKKSTIRWKEQYWREYDEAKKEGHSFFPDHVAKDAVMSLVAVLVILGLATFAEAPLGDKADPSVQVFSPRPDWYFFFLFQILHWFTNSNTVVLGTVILPTIFFGLLFLVPFIDRGRERRAWKRPVATGIGLVVLAGVAILTVQGGSQPEAEAAGELAGLSAADAEVQSGYEVFQSQGCGGCHNAQSEAKLVGPGLGGYGAKGGLGKKDRFDNLQAYIKNPQQFGAQGMPAFPNIGETDLNNLAAFLKANGKDFNQNYKGP